MKKITLVSWEGRWSTSGELLMPIATMAIIMTDQYHNKIVLVKERTLNGRVVIMQIMLLEWKLSITIINNSYCKKKLYLISWWSYYTGSKYTQVWLFAKCPINCRKMTGQFIDLKYSARYCGCLFLLFVYTCVSIIINLIQTGGRGRGLPLLILKVYNFKSM